MRTILLINNLFLILSLIQGNGLPQKAQLNSSVPVTRLGHVENSPSLAGMTISVEAATEATIEFKSENGKQVSAPQGEDRKIPYLVLNRNGALTPHFERTLHVSLDNLAVPPTGLYASLEIETQHSDPDLGRGSTDKIRVWEEERFIPSPTEPQTAQSIDFTFLFPRVFENQGKIIPTPSDYYSYRIRLSDGQRKPLRDIEQPYAFLLENQWRVPLPKVLEETPGAAPQELVLYFYDMIPFQSSFRDPETRIPRQDVERYIQTELIPAMVDAFKIQTDLWNLPWYKEWTNYRSEEDPKTLSVALDEYGTWFHGAAPSLGHAMISIRVDGSFGEYASITDGIMSVFHHELFHNQQRNISLHFGSKGIISGREGAWELFSEGTAVLASLVGQPRLQMSPSNQPRSYLKRANAFIGADGIFPGGLNMSYTEMPYQTALYWRYLYEQCGGINNGTEDPATGMQVIRHVLETLYSGEIVDFTSSVSAVADLPLILDVALYKTPTCPFQSYRDSLIHFTQAIYQLRRSNGSCQDQSSTQCGFFDPNKLYATPGEQSYTIVMVGKTNINGSIRSSFGVDLVRISAGPNLEGESLKILFKSASDPEYTYNVELWEHRAHKGGTAGVVASKQTSPATPVIEIEQIDLEDLSAVELVVTRTDTNENVLQPGDYIIQVIVN